jgi:ribonuclease P protein component
MADDRLRAVGPGPAPRPGAGLGPAERVRDPGHFRRAFERRRPVSDAVLVLHVAENGLGFPRLGISVPRRLVRKATGRNRIKRRVREAFRLQKQDLPRGLDLIVVPRKLDLTPADVRASLTTLARDAERRIRRAGP